MFCHGVQSAVAQPGAIDHTRFCAFDDGLGDQLSHRIGSVYEIQRGQHTFKSRSHFADCVLIESTILQHAANRHWTSPIPVSDEASQSRFLNGKKARVLCAGSLAPMVPAGDSIH